MPFSKFLDVGARQKIRVSPVIAVARRLDCPAPHFANVKQVQLAKKTFTTTSVTEEDKTNDL